MQEFLISFHLIDKTAAVLLQIALTQAVLFVVLYNHFLVKFRDPQMWDTLKRNWQVAEYSTSRCNTKGVLEGRGNMWPEEARLMPTQSFLPAPPLVLHSSTYTLNKARWKPIITLTYNPKNQVSIGLSYKGSIKNTLGLP